MDVPEGFLTAVRDGDKIEALVPCVGFDDLLELNLLHNLPHLDSLLVVTSLTDAKTVQVCRRYGVEVIQTEAFGHRFAKGAGVNVGFGYFKYRGWRLLLDADVLLPDNFRRILLNHTSLDRACLYGADRVDVIGQHGYETIQADRPQWGLREEVFSGLPIRSRLVTKSCGYLPLGYFQLWHGSAQKAYPSSADGAGLDDVLYAQLWPSSHRRLLPSVIVYHLCVDTPILGENWDGIRRHPRMKE
jgi:hypothetical protein